MLIHPLLSYPDIEYNKQFIVDARLIEDQAEMNGIHDEMMKYVYAHTHIHTPSHTRTHTHTHTHTYTRHI